MLLNIKIKGIFRKLKRITTFACLQRSYYKLLLVRVRGMGNLSTKFFRHSIFGDDYYTWVQIFTYVII